MKRLASIADRIRDSAATGVRLVKVADFVY
jgi:hypothetical protein